MKTDKVLDEFKSKREVIHVSEFTDEMLEEIMNAEWGKVSETGTRKLSDVKIADALNTLDVDPKNTVGTVIEPDKEIEWKDVKEKG